MNTFEMTVETKLIDDVDLPPLIIKADDRDFPKILINRAHKTWLMLYRKEIAGCAEHLFKQLDRMLTAHLQETRNFEKMEEEDNV
jgi:hypothetical protein|tara:strand:- start:4978 stop:5232 length:255 start_codon:yes stop_codon:yes gene_type:complete